MPLQVAGQRLHQAFDLGIGPQPQHAQVDAAALLVQRHALGARGHEAQAVVARDGAVQRRQQRLQALVQGLELGNALHRHLCVVRRLARLAHEEVHAALAAELVHARQACRVQRVRVARDAVGAVEDLAAVLLQAQAELDVFRAHAHEAFVEAAVAQHELARDAEVAGVEVVVVVGLVRAHAPVVEDQVRMVQAVAHRAVQPHEVGVHREAAQHRRLRAAAGVLFQVDLQRLRLQQRVVVEEQHPLAAGALQAAVARGGRAQVGLALVLHAGRGDHLRRVVAGAVVDDDDLEALRRQRLRRQLRQAAPQDRRAVEGGDDDRQHRHRRGDGRNGWRCGLDGHLRRCMRHHRRDGSTDRATFEVVALHARRSQCAAQRRRLQLLAVAVDDVDEPGVQRVQEDEVEVLVLGRLHAARLVLQEVLQHRRHLVVLARDAVEHRHHQLEGLQAVGHAVAHHVVVHRVLLVEGHRVRELADRETVQQRHQHRVVVPVREAHVVVGLLVEGLQHAAVPEPDVEAGRVVGAFQALQRVDLDTAREHQRALDVARQVGQEAGGVGRLQHDVGVDEAAVRQAAGAEPREHVVHAHQRLAGALAPVAMHLDEAHLGVLRLQLADLFGVVERHHVEAQRAPAGDGAALLGLALGRDAGAHRELQAAGRGDRRARSADDFGTRRGQLLQHAGQGGGGAAAQVGVAGLQPGDEAVVGGVEQVVQPAGGVEAAEAQAQRLGSAGAAQRRHGSGRRHAAAHLHAVDHRALARGLGQQARPALAAAGVVAAGQVGQRAFQQRAREQRRSGVDEARVAQREGCVVQRQRVHGRAVRREGRLRQRQLQARGDVEQAVDVLGRGRHVVGRQPDVVVAGPGRVRVGQQLRQRLPARAAAFDVDHAVVLRGLAVRAAGGIADHQVPVAGGGRCQPLRVQRRGACMHDDEKALVHGVHGRWPEAVFRSSAGPGPGRRARRCPAARRPRRGWGSGCRCRRARG